MFRIMYKSEIHEARVIEEEARTSKSKIILVDKKIRKSYGRRLE
jgi:hypothetical protein